VIQTGSILNSILGVHWLLFVISAHSREAGSSKDRQPGLPGIGGEPGGPMYPGIGGEKVNMVPGVMVACDFSSPDCQSLQQSIEYSGGRPGVWKGFKSCFADSIFLQHENVATNSMKNVCGQMSDCYVLYISTSVVQLDIKSVKK
jgi:hypothetical protein